MQQPENDSPQLAVLQPPQAEKALPYLAKKDAWARAYIWVAVPLACFYVLFVPPFQVADEHNHFERAEHLLQGNLRAENHGSTSGGQIDTGLSKVADLFGAEQPPRSTSIGAWQIHWSNQLAYREFSNTVRYPPPLYLPQMFGIALSKMLGLPVLGGLYLARLANAIVMILASFWAIKSIDRGKSLLCYVLLLPMACQELFSCAQDAGVIAGGALIAASLEQGKRNSTTLYLCMVGAIAAVATARPPLAPLAGLLLLQGFPAKSGRKTQVGTCLMVVALILAWFAIMRQATGSIVAGTDAGLQARHVAQDPIGFVQMAFKCLQGGQAEFLLHGAIGILGWSNVDLNPLAYTLGLSGFMLTCLAVSLQRSHLRWKARLAVAVVIFACVFMMILATYMTWNPVGASDVIGMQGRYFLPLLPLLVAVVPYAQVIPARALPAMQRICVVGAIACGIVTAGFGVFTVASTYRFFDSFPFLVN